MNDSPSAPENRSQPSFPSRRQLLILSIISGAVLLFVAVAILVYLGLRGPDQPSVETPTPTESVRPTTTRPAALGPTPSCRAILSTGDIEISMALPTSLTVAGATYPVEAFVPQEAAWVYPSHRSGQALWVCGSVVNYVIGLEPNAAHEELLGSLEAGADMRLQLTNGAVLLFRFAERRETTAGADAVLDQQEAKLTIVLPKGEMWDVAVADYVTEAERVEVPIPEAVSAEPGQAVEVGQARVTMVRGYLERSDQLSRGTAYYVVEFSVENLGETALDADLFTTELEDGLDNRYPVSPRAAAVGEFGPLSGVIEPGMTAEGTSGFVVPDPLPAGDLTWIFSPRLGSEIVRGRIPYEGEPIEEDPALQPDVAITDAFLSRDGSTLVIEGEVWNRSAQPLEVESTDVSLSSSAGLGEFVMAAPALPWRIEPEQRQVIELQYERPNASTVLLELLGYSFEIGGLE